ncbi:MAG: hypothetical protein OXE44_12310 [Nitrospinae bacterium]|nr:hypothetical protein [Nitrospinota bacterium]
MANSRYREIGDAILAEISNVAGAGRVHSYQRWSADLGKYLDHFRWQTGDGLAQIRGWVLTRERAGEEAASVGSNAAGGFTPAGISRRTHTFLLFGIMSAEDAVGSEVVFQELLEEICDRFRDDRTLRLLDESGSPRVRSLERLQPPQVDLIELRTFGNVLCHYAEIRLRAIERIRRD